MTRHSNGVQPTVLVVEDDPSRLAEVLGLLESTNFHALSCTDGNAVPVVAVEERVAAVILCGDGMIGGVALGRRLRAMSALKNVPLLFLTDTNAGFDVGAAYALGTVDHLERAHLKYTLAPRLARLAAHVQANGDHQKWFNPLDRSLGEYGDTTGLLGFGDIGLAVFDLRTETVACDPVMARMYGLDVDQAQAVPADTIRGLVHPDDYERTMAIYDRASAENRIAEVDNRLRTPEGGWRHVLARSWFEYDTHGAPVRMPYITIDATLLRSTENAYRQTEQRYRKLIESMEDGFAIVDLIEADDGHIVDYRFAETNRAFEQQSGLRNPVGRRIRELLPDIKARWFEQFEQAARSGGFSRRSTNNPTRNRWFDVSVTPIGEPGSLQMAVLLHDVTARKNNERDLERFAAEMVEADRRKTDFLATLSHELRNPLASIRNGLELLQPTEDDAKEDNSRAATWAMMNRQLGQIVHLIDDLLDIARISRDQISLRRERIVFNAILDHALESVQPLLDTHNHVVDLDLCDPPLPFDADPMRMTQIIANLIDNAAKYTPQGGRLAIRTWREDHTACFSVSDNGIGIDAEDFERVFESFVRVKRDDSSSRDGLGVGLTLVRRLIELHDGCIEVQSPGVGHGCTFTVRLPLAQDPAKGAEDVDAAPIPIPSDTTAAHTSATAQTLRVLIVDDNVDAGKTLAFVLRRSGYAVHLAENGAQTLIVASEVQPDVVFLDIGLPDMSGYDLAPRLRKIDGLQNVIIVALTGYGSATDRERAHAAGIDRHLTKPASLAAIREMLNEIATQ